jgi:ATP-dependent protease ClpP protease subunit
MASGMKDSNILWLTDNIDSVEGFKAVYARFNALQADKKVPWILLNVCSEGSQNVTYSNAILSLLLSSEKPIKTQIMSGAESFGILLACVGEERKAWPHAEFMHHSYHIDLDHTSIEDMEVRLKSLKVAERKSLNFMRQQMGDAGYRAMMNDFKKAGCKDMYFSAEKAVEYNIVHEIGIIQPVYF